MGYKFPALAPGEWSWSAAQLFPAALFSLTQLAAWAGCVATCWWLVQSKENTGREVAAKALRWPVLAGLVLISLSVVIGLSCTAETSLLLHHYSKTQYGTIALSRAVAGMIISPLETIGLVVLTVLLLRRRLHLSKAS